MLTDREHSNRSSNLKRWLAIGTAMVACQTLYGRAEAQGVVNLGPGTSTTGNRYRLPTATPLATFTINVAPNTVLDNTTNPTTNPIDLRGEGDAVVPTIVSLNIASAALLRSTDIFGVGLLLVGGANVTNGGDVVSQGSVGLGILANAPSQSNNISIANTQTGRIYGSRAGVVADSIRGNISISNAGLISEGAATFSSGSSSYPIIATRASNGIAINGGTRQISDIDTTAAAVVARTTGTGTIDVVNATTGSILSPIAGIASTLDGSGRTTILNQGRISAPIGMISGSASGLVSVTNTGTISGATVGAAGGSAAPVVVANSGTISFGQFGIAATSALSSTLINDGTLAQDGSLPNQITPEQRARLLQPFQQVTPATVAAVLGRTFGGDIAITNNGRITADIGIDAAVLSGASGTATGRLAITNNGTIVAKAAAIDTTLSLVPAQILNAGSLTGSVALSSGSSFTNSGQFVTGGTSGFGGGTLVNTGTIALAGGTTPVSATLGNLGTLSNGGVIDLRTGSAANTLTVAGNYAGSNGTLLLQASTQAGTSDRLVITGNATGSTGVAVSNLTPGVAFTTSPVLVQVNGTLAANAFTLTSAQNFGTLQPVIVSGTNSAGNTVSIGAVPTATALSAPTAILATRTIAQQGNNAILDRVQQLRDGKIAAGGTPATPAARPLAYQATGYAALISKDPIAQNVVEPVAPVDTSVRPAVWARATGDYERRTGSTSFSFGGSTFTRDLGYGQETGALLGGADVIVSGLTSKEDAIILGVLGGGTLATVNLRQGAGRQDYNGGTVGAYATYLNGPFFADALFKVDLLGLDIVAPGLRQSTGLQNYSIASNVGYRFNLDRGVYVEPTAGLDYVTTVFDRTAALTASTIPLRDGDALRGRVGVRVGSETIVDEFRFEPSITAFAYTVLTESNPSGAFNGVTSITGLRDVGKARGELQAALNVFNLKTGVSGFLRADMRVGEDLLAGGGRVGVRYQW